MDLTEKLKKEGEKLFHENLQNICKLDNDRRPHLGMSQIGHDCRRKIFMSFRWFNKVETDSRKQRIFNMGHMLEAYIVEQLKKSYQVWDFDPKSGEQFRSQDPDNKFYSGSWDGVIKIDEPYLLEIKSYNNARFNTLKKDGVQSSDFSYHVQMQCYLKKASQQGIKKALFYAYNKNTSEIYTEIIDYDGGNIYQAMSAKADCIIDDFLANMPKYKPTFYKCKMCEFTGVCHKGKSFSKNCRTCQYSEFNKENGKVYCTNYADSTELVVDEVVLNYETQLKGCGEYVPLSVGG